jgi:DnaJ homolog subfamily C member 28
MMEENEQPIDKIIREAREAGAFDNLPGKGKPLRWEDDTFVPEEQRMANHLLKNNGFTLDWIEMSRELDQTWEEIRAEVEKARAEHSSGQLSERGWRAAARAASVKIRKLNLRIIGYNLRVPHEHFQRQPYPIDPDIKENLD